jgi:hypothetical protein
LIFPKWIFNNIKSVIKRSGLAYHKEKHFRRHQIKEITGVIIDGDNIKVCNRHQKSIHDLLMQVATTEDIPLMNKLCNRLIGKLSAAGQIEDRFKIQRFQALQTRHRLNKHNSSPRARTSPSRHTQ